MLKELKNIRQNEGDPYRRIFNGEKLSLIIWYEGNIMTGFQLNYEFQREQLSLTWDSNTGFSHKTVDDGEGRPFKHKMSAVTLIDKEFNKDFILEIFCNESDSIEKIERERIYELLKAV